MIRLQEMINNLKDEEEDYITLDKEKSQLVDKQYNADKEKLNKIKLFLVSYMFLLVYRYSTVEIIYLLSDYY